MEWLLGRTSAYYYLAMNLSMNNTNILLGVINIT